MITLSLFDDYSHATEVLNTGVRSIVITLPLRGGAKHREVRPRFGECVGGHCQVEQKHADQFIVVDCYSVTFGRQKGLWLLNPTRPFPQAAPILPQLDNAPGKLLQPAEPG